MSTTRVWSPYQEAIFAHVADPTAGSAIVRAVAGSGKSTTIVEAMDRAPDGTNSIFLAFNKAIAEELKSRGVNARTFHSLCYSPVTRATGVKAVNGNKLTQILRDETLFRSTDNAMYGAAACKLVGLARNAGIGAIVDDTDNEWLALVDRHDVSPDADEGTSISRMIEIARKLLFESNRSKELDFDDLLYRAVKDNVALSRYDLIMVDEAQDTNTIQRAILRKIMNPGARIIAVGDSAQAIYGFRGADSSAMAVLAKEFDAKSLPLTVTYRCAKAIVKCASQWSPLEAAENAKDGIVSDLGFEWSFRDFGEKDLVVCRTNAPLISLAYRMISARIPCHIMGREIGAGLTSLIKKLNPAGIKGLLEKLDAWEDRETLRAKAKSNDSMVASIGDKASSIRFLIDTMSEAHRTVPELIRTIETLFESKAGVTLASIHKSKGLEADTVWWLNRSACPSKWAKQDWQIEQELNLCYVAATRAKNTLVLIETKKREEE